LSEEPSFCQSWQIVEPETLPNEDVSSFMTAGPVTVGAGVRISELARRMVDAHIHRVIVVDEDCRPKGVISSTDILAAVAYADPAAGQPEI
jgi:predicted transcriptional regulator